MSKISVLNGKFICFVWTCQLLIRDDRSASIQKPGTKCQSLLILSLDTLEILVCNFHLLQQVA